MYTFQKLLITFLMLVTSLSAYEFSFYNNAKNPIAIAIQFADGDQEPLYKQYIKPRSLKSFVPGTTVDIPDIKWSFCLKNIFYAKNPTMEERAHYFAKAIWRPITITWTDEPLAHEPKKPQKLHAATKKTPAPDHVMITKKPAVKVDEKTLCKDRHFEIMEDKDGMISIVASTKS